MTQALHMANGDTLNDKLRAEHGAVASLLSSKASNAEVLDTLFLAALSRRPTDSERTRMTDVLVEAARGCDGDERETARRQAIEDLYWAVLTSPEFLFNH